MRRLSCSAVSALLVAIVVPGPMTVAAQSLSGATPAPTSWQLSAQDTFRLESWQFFEPNPGGGEPHYTFGANRLLLQARRTIRRYSQTTVYSTMNLNDAFVMLTARPRNGLTVRFDLHRLSLASAGDRWYAGSGATLSDCSNFGFTGRSSSGQTALGTSFESSLAWVFSPRWSINGFAGLMRGGRVVTSLFKGEHLGFFYFENVVRLGQ